MKIYLSGQVDGLSLKESVTWRQEATKFLKDFNIQVCDPTEKINKKFMKSKEALMSFDPKEVEPNFNMIVSRDLQAIRQSDVVLCYMMLEDTLKGKHIPLGTSMEMGIAALIYQMPVIGVTNCLEGRPWWSQVVTKSYNNIQSALAYIAAHYDARY